MVNPQSAVDADREFQTLYRTLRSLRCRPEEPRPYPAHVISGLETQTDPTIYAWHGRKRLGDAKNPFLVWQYTLAGSGAFQSGATKELALTSPGYAFTTLVPSDDFYFLPSESRSWTFFWLIIDHPYIVRRVRDRIRLTGPIWQVPPRSPLVERALNLFDLVRAASLPDEFAEEADLFGFLTEFERLGHQILYPPLPRERVLNEVRAEIIGRLPSGVPSVSELAEERGMSRTGFTHYFRRTTGLSPARFINQVRLEEVTKLLVSSSLKLSAIAEQTGFADATHLGKVFRRHYYLTPDKYRHVMGTELSDHLKDGLSAAS
jgi:AraC-like DNA-binding protein